MCGLIADLTNQTHHLAGHFNWSFLDTKILFHTVVMSCVLLFDAVMISVFFGVLSCFARKPFMKKNSAVNFMSLCNEMQQSETATKRVLE